MTGQGAMAPIAAFTNAGHQAQRTVVEVLPDFDFDVESHFMPDDSQNRILLYGSNFVEVQPSTTGAAFGSSQTFTFSNDVDAIGDMYARVEVTAKMSTNSPSALLQPLTIARIIDRLEVHVGNSTWQTMENADIIAMAATQLDSGAYDVYNSQAAGGQTVESGKDKSLNLVPGTNTSTANVTFVAWVPLPTFTAGGPAESHLIAGAPHQSMRVKLSYVGAGALTSQPGIDATVVPTLAVQLWNRQHIMTNFEREQIRNNTIAKTIKLTQHAEHTESEGTNASMTVELDSFSLLASHLIISAETSKETAGTSLAYLQSAELLLNTSTHSGPLDGSFMISSTGQSMGLKTNVVDAYNATGQVGGDAARRDFYVFPLAASPFGPDGCPLNRFDTIRLRLTWGYFPGQVHVTCVGTTTAVYKNQAASVLYFS